MDGLDIARHGSIELGGVPSEELYARLARKSFIHFIKVVAPWFKIEEFHIIVAKHLEDCLNGKCSRLIINAPPRAGKSSLVNIFLPAWWFGHYPSDQVMAISHSIKLSKNHGAEARAIMESPIYRRIFPDVATDKRRRALERWRVTSFEEELKSINDKDGIFMAAGQRSGIAGHGFNLGLVDDPISEQDADSDTKIANVNDWWLPGFYTRRQPERNVIILIMTRWRDDDLVGHVLNLDKSMKYGKRFKVINIPALLSPDKARVFAKVSTSEFANTYCEKLHDRCCGDGSCDDGEVPDYLPSKVMPFVSFAPRRWPVEELLETRELMRKQGAEDKWRALYMGKPRRRSGVIMPTKRWRKWDTEKYGELIIEKKIMMMDTAFEPKEEADFSAMTIWGIFYNTSAQMYNTILLDAKRGKWGFPELKEISKAQYKLWRPDDIYIERRASGHSLIQELRRSRFPVKPYEAPGGANAASKRNRAHAAGLIMDSGSVWYSANPSVELSIQEVLDECSSYPSSEHDDYVDTVSMALSYLRNTFWLETAGDKEELDDYEREQLLEEQYARRKSILPAY